MIPLRLGVDVWWQEGPLGRNFETLSVNNIVEYHWHHAIFWSVLNSRWCLELMSDDKRVHWAWMGTVIQGGGAPVSPVQSVQIQCTEMFIILAKTRTVTLSWIWYTKRHTQLHKNTYAKTHRSFQRLPPHTIVLKKYYTRATLLVLWSCMWLYVVHSIVGLHIDLWPGNTKSTV